MKVLVIGGGGREHAIVWKLAQSELADQIWCAPGNAGIAQERLRNGRHVDCVKIHAEDLPGLLSFAKEVKPDLTIVGPDNPLGMGIVDLFEAHGLPIWGPNKQAALFESSKIFSHGFMQRHGIPCPAGLAFDDPDRALDYAAKLGGRCAVKADGLALGKGVIVCRNIEEAKNAIEMMLRRRVFGEAGARILIQELVEGVELSLHAMCDGTHAVLFPTSQDHKRAYDGDQGPNTGGMGTYSPTPFLDNKQLMQVRKLIIDRWLEGCRIEGIHFRGILYPGIMLSAEGPKVLEFNVRFGDPETQVYMMRLKSDLLQLVLASMEGRLNESMFHWDQRYALCVVMASAGYPGQYEKGKEIRGLGLVANLPDVKIFHAGTALTSDGKIVTSGGRVLGVTAVGQTLKEAREKAYQAVDLIKFEGAFYRKDIGLKAMQFE